MRTKPTIKPLLSRDAVQACDTHLGDLRFRALLPKDAWEQLSPAVRARFTKRLANGKTATYVGEVTRARFSRLGWMLAHAARLIGGPLPTGIDVGVPSIVTVTEDMATGGQIWTRIYTSRRAFPQVIHSSKRFSGPTGLEEYVGCGISMALHVAVNDRALVFRSAGYIVSLAGWRITLPDWLTPGALTVTHEDLGDGRFRFALAIVHPRFGVLIDQAATFREATP